MTRARRARSRATEGEPGGRPPPTESSARRSAARRCACCGSGTSTSRPTSRRRAATVAPLRGGARGTDRGRRGRRALGQPFLDISDRVTRAARAGCCRWPSRPTTRARGASSSTTPTTRATSRSTPPALGRHPNRADPGSRRSVIRVPHFRFNHKGGQLQFGPDGMLYAGFGDGGAGGDPDENAQNLGQLLGKLIRIDPRPAGATACPPTTRSVAARARGRRSTPTGCATPTASRSTARAAI